MTDPFGWGWRRSRARPAAGNSRTEIDDEQSVERGHGGAVAPGSRSLRAVTPRPGTRLRRMTDYSDLRAVYINCTLKRSPDVSHTQGLADRSIAIMESNGVSVEQFRAIDHEIATGVWPDMTE